MHDIKPSNGAYVCLSCAVRFKTVAETLDHVHPELPEEEGGSNAI